MTDVRPGSLGKRLRQERELRHWTQEQLAEHIGRSVPSINRWEHDRAEPQPDALKQLAALFGKPPDRWGTSRWNVPFLRNPYFTGREQLLLRLHRTLAAEKTVALSQTRVISGLGGIGKTQTALEYAYRYAREYEAVLWVQADSHELLVSDFARLAQTLDLPGREEQDQWRVVSAVKRWLQEHSAWLLILDNADDLTLLADFLPRGMGGATLVTTRSQVTGKIARSVSVDKMEVSEGIRFVLRRAKLLEEDEPLETVSAATRTAAQQLVEELDGLPLALDQAGGVSRGNRVQPVGVSGPLCATSIGSAQAREQRGQRVSTYGGQHLVPLLLTGRAGRPGSSRLAARVRVSASRYHSRGAPDRRSCGIGSAIAGSRGRAVAAQWGHSTLAPLLAGQA
jgi:transcriptional regulator with XRE-family HTH domain